MVNHSLTHLLTRGQKIQHRKYVWQDLLCCGKIGLAVPSAKELKSSTVLIRISQLPPASLGGASDCSIHARDRCKPSVVKRALRSTLRTIVCALCACPNIFSPKIQVGSE
jgi:hypothetical protein